MEKSSWRRLSLTEGAVVAVVTRGADESFSLTEAQENELLAAMAEIERGEYVTLEELRTALSMCSRCGMRAASTNRRYE